MIFDPSKTPSEKESFDNWFQTQTDWSDDVDYDSPNDLNINLSSCFRELIKKFPPMNGELAVPDEEMDDYTTDYSLSKDFIYACFAWSVEDEAYSLAKELAVKYSLGVYDCDYKFGIEVPRESKKSWQFWKN